MLKTTMTLAAATVLLGLSVEIRPQGGEYPEPHWTVKVRISPEAQAEFKESKVYFCCAATPTQTKRPSNSGSLKRPRGSNATKKRQEFRWWYDYSGGN